MAVSSNTVTVSHTAPTLIVPAANPTANASGFRPGNITVTILNTDGSVTVYLGGPAVGTSGYQLLKNASVTFSLGPGDSVYGLASSGAPQVCYLATG